MNVFQKNGRTFYFLTLSAALMWQGCTSIDVDQEHAYASVACYADGDCQASALWTDTGDTHAECGPDGDGTFTVYAEFAAPIIHFLVDQSNSMDRDINSEDITTGVASRWEVMKAALLGEDEASASILHDLQSRAQIGISLYSSPSEDQYSEGYDECPVLQTSVAPALGNFAAIEAEFRDAEPMENTPTAESLARVFDADGGGFPAKSDSGAAPRIVVIATDGQPDTCEVRNPNGETTQAALNRENVRIAQEVQRAHDVQFYMLWVGPSYPYTERHVQEMANVGIGLAPEKRDEEYQAPYFAAASMEGLDEQVNELIDHAYRCVFTTEQDVESIAAMTMGGESLEYGSEWIINEDKHLELLGDVCTLYRIDTDAIVEAKAVCPVIDDPEDPTTDPEDPTTDPTDPGNPTTDPTDPENPTTNPEDPTTDPANPEDPENPGTPDDGHSDEVLIYGGGGLGGCSASGNTSNGSGSALVILLLGLISRTRIRRGCRWWAERGAIYQAATVRRRRRHSNRWSPSGTTH